MYNQHSPLHIREWKTCAAPAPYALSRDTVCGKAFLAMVHHQQYCCSACRTRAQKWNRKTNIERRAVAATASDPKGRIYEDIRKFSKIPIIDEEDALAKLGYSADPSKLSKQRQQELGANPLGNPQIKPQPDRSAEPKLTPPQFEEEDLTPTLDDLYGPDQSEL